MYYSQPPPSPLEVGHAQISPTDILVESFGLKDDANIELLRDFVDRISHNPMLAHVTTFGYLMKHSEMLSALNRKTDEIKDMLTSQISRINFHTPKAFTDAARDVCWHHLMSPVNHYYRLPDIIINFIWENAARYNLQAYSESDVIRAQINREVSSILSDVKGTFRTTIFNSVNPKWKGPDIHTFVREMYTKRHIGGSAPIPITTIGHIAFLRNIARPCASITKSKGDRSSSGFWEDVGIQLTAVVHKYGQDRTSPAWIAWAEQQVNQDLRSCSLLSNFWEDPYTRGPSSLSSHDRDEAQEKRSTFADTRPSLDLYESPWNKFRDRERSFVDMHHATDRYHMRDAHQEPKGTTSNNSRQIAAPRHDQRSVFGSALPKPLSCPGPPVLRDARYVSPYTVDPCAMPASPHFGHGPNAVRDR